jgi:hypothetical protein
VTDPSEALIVDAKVAGMNDRYEGSTNEFFTVRPGQLVVASMLDSQMWRAL